MQIYKKTSTYEISAALVYVLFVYRLGVYSDGLTD